MNYKHFILFLISCAGSQWALGQNIEFIENRGQWDSRVKFMGSVAAGAFYVHDNGFTVVQHDTADWARITDKIHHRFGDDPQNAKTGAAEAPLTMKSHAYRVQFLEGAGKPQLVADKPLSTHNNYFIGNDPSKWASDCKIYGGITIKNIYPNIDVRYYSGSGRVKYDLIVHPGGDPSRIALKYDGANGLEVKNKELVIKTSVGNLRELNPYTYQYKEAGRVSVGAKYSVKNDVVRFDINEYDPKTTLIIDPDLVFCSFSGSNGSDNWGFTATYGPDGSMFGGGIVMSQGWPVSTGAFQTNFGGGFDEGYRPIDIGVIKLSPDGSQRIYATYIGGNGNEMPHSLIVTPQNELVVAGRSNSFNYPTNNTPRLGPARTDADRDFDIVVTKLNAAGNAIIGSKMIGGKNDDGANITKYNGSNASSLARNYGDDARSEVNLDGAGNVYVASCTRSTDFYTINAFQNSNNGAQDGVLLKLNPSLSSVLFSTYVGGSGNDAAYVVAIHPFDGNIYIGGGTESTDMPQPRTNTIGPSNFGTIDGFVSIFNSTGTHIKTSYIGTSDIDQVYGLHFDDKGFPYIMGQTLGNWPVLNAAFSQNNGRQFIAKLQPDLSAFVYSTKFGKGQASPDISPIAFLVDRCENVYISGWGGRLNNFPNAGVSNLTITPDAIKSTPDPGPSGLGDDFYFFVLKKDAASQLYGSFFGQNGGQFGDHVDGGTSRFSRDGVIYQAICASCGNTNPFPTTPGVWSPTKPAGSNCNLAMVKIAFNLAGIRGDVRPSINGVPRDSSGCVPLTVDFTDTIQEAQSYEWNFGDGSPTIFTTRPDTSHTYLNVGVYQVMMVAIDSTKCVPRDTTFTSISVGDNQALPNFNAVKLSPPCEIFRYRFDNTTSLPSGYTFRSNTFVWDFGDGTARVTAGPESVFHTYANAGTYNVKLYLSDTTFCNSPDSLVQPVRVAANVKAIFATPSNGCAPYDAVIQNNSIGGSRFIWDFGDGSAPQTINTATVRHLFINPGTYRIRMTAIDSNTCNIVDTTSFALTVSPIPTAFFDFSPRTPQVNTPVTYTNLSSVDAIRFKWVWGDGDSLLTNSRGTVQHEFNLSGTYRTCLTAYNQSGCEARYCEPVSSLVDPAVDVPNAFTPQSGDANSRIFVRGYGIIKLKFAIYARWGEKVFESADKRIGWDGRFKGQLLPMDVYAYTLDVEMADGKKVRKTGDITLIR